MNSKIKALMARLDALNESRQSARTELQTEYSKVFSTLPQLRVLIALCEESQEYQISDHGDVEQWIRITSGLEAFSDCIEYLSDWFADQGFRLDVVNSTLLNNCGSDNLMIQDDAWQRYNGVWQNNKLIIPESLYRNEDLEVDEIKRNELIEAHMEHTGVFPGVFRQTKYGDVFRVSTVARKAPEGKHI